LPSLAIEERELSFYTHQGFKQTGYYYCREKSMSRQKILPPLLQHPTNTCEPLSGSWTEHLLTIAEYQKNL